MPQAAEHPRKKTSNVHASPTTNQNSGAKSFIALVVSKTMLTKDPQPENLGPYTFNPWMSLEEPGIETPKSDSINIYP